MLINSGDHYKGTVKVNDHMTDAFGPINMNTHFNGGDHRDIGVTIITCALLQPHNMLSDFYAFGSEASFVDDLARLVTWASSARPRPDEEIIGPPRSPVNSGLNNSPSPAAATSVVLPQSATPAS